MKKIIVCVIIIPVFIGGCASRKYLKPTRFEKIEELEYSPVQQQLVASAIKKALNKEMFSKFRKGNYFIEIVPLLGTEKEGRLRNLIPFLRKCVEAGIGLNGGRIVESGEEANYIVTILLDAIGIEIYKTNVLYIYRTTTNVGIVSGSFVLRTTDGQILQENEFFGSSANTLKNVIGVDLYNPENIKADILQLSGEE